MKTLINNKVEVLSSSRAMVGTTEMTAEEIVSHCKNKYPNNFITKVTQDGQAILVEMIENYGN